MHFRPVRERFGDWHAFVEAQHDLTDDERRVWLRHRAWFADLLTTKMVKAYKMLALSAMLEHESFFEGMEVAKNAELSLEIARRTLPFYREDEQRGSFSEQSVRLWRSMPLTVWAQGEGGRAWFALENDMFRPTFEVAQDDRSTFEDLTSEIIELRLKEHLDRLRRVPLRADALPIVLKVSHSSSRPILRFDRSRRTDIPETDVNVVVDGRSYVFQFRTNACKVALEPGASANVLPSLLRGWFGPAAGLPGSRHSVELQSRDDYWVLSRPASAELAAAISAEPNLPFFSELKVACGAINDGDKLSAASTSIAINAGRVVDPSKHFVVRASGDSMNGGAEPICDGDLVLCEWWKGGGEGDINGKPMLIIGHYDSENSFAAMKVPVKREGSWVLHSWNPTEKDQPLPADVRIEPVARVVGVVEETIGLTLYAKYAREQIAHMFGSSNDPSWGVGHRNIDLHGKAHSVLMVDLRKDADTKMEHRYADVFLSRSEFQWESQASTTPQSSKGRGLIHHEKEGRVVHLFARYRKRSDDFAYCGTMVYQRHEGEKPMRIWWKLNSELPESLWRSWAL